MADIILDSRKIMVYEDLKYLVEFTGKDEALADVLWSALLENSGLYEEFLYYIDNKAIKDEFSFRGYHLTDLYIYILGRSRISNDYGKDIQEQKREAMVLDTFLAMVNLINNPDKVIKLLEEGRGMDSL